MVVRIEATGLSVSRGDMLIVNDLALELHAGESMVLTGANGSGKSTALRALLGLVQTTSGESRFFNDGESQPLAYASHYLAHQNAMKPELSARENLAFWQKVMGDFESNTLRTASCSIAQAGEAVGLEAALDLPFAYLSAGQKRRLAFARLLVAHRPVWLLDEPTAALDLAAKDTFASLMNTHLARGGMIIAATHEPLGLADQKAIELNGPWHIGADPFLAEDFA